MRILIVTLAFAGGAGSGGFGTVGLNGYYRQKDKVEALRREVAAGRHPELKAVLKEIDGGVMAAYLLLGEAAFCAIAVVLTLDRRHLVAGILLLTAFVVPLAFTKNFCAPFVTACTGLAGIFSFVAAVAARLEPRRTPPKLDRPRGPLPPNSWDDSDPLR